MKTDRVLIATRSFGSTSPRPWDILTEAGCELVRADMTRQMTERRLIGLLKGVDGAIIGVVPMTARVMENAPRLKVVSMHGVGLDHVDLEAAARLGIAVANCPGTNGQAVADLAIGLMVSIARTIPAVDRQVRQGGWGRYQGVELWQKTLGLVGLGFIGRAVAKRAQGFDMRVMVYDPYIESNVPELPEIEFTSLQEVLAAADFLSLHATLNDETRHMLGGPQFEIMKPTCYLINTARGELVEEQALFHALTHGQIAGAALDVYPVEPPVESPLLALDNVVLTPHLGAHTVEAIERTSVQAAQNVLLGLQGKELLHRVV